MNMLPSKRKSPQVSESRASLAGLIENTSATLNAVSARLKDGVASAEELIKCSKLAPRSRRHKTLCRKDGRRTAAFGLVGDSNFAWERRSMDAYGSTLRAPRRLMPEWP